MLWQQQRRIESGDSQASVEQEATVRELEAILQNELKWHKNSRKAGMGWKFAQGRKVLRLEKRRGKVITDPSEVPNIWQRYYKQSFSSQHLDENDQQYYIKQLDKNLTPDEASLCEGPIYEEECLNALNTMKKEKTPGCDGLPAEFYQTFWSILGGDLVQVFNSCYNSGTLSNSQRLGIISLLYKKGDTADPDNWRPISLLCADYKILSKTLANRLLLVIGNVINPDQTCGVPGRFIGENVALVRDIIEYSQAANLPGIIISLDQNKAFDRVEWCYLHRVLKAMGFGPTFLCWIKLLYTNCCQSTEHKWVFNWTFFVGRGVR